MYAVCYFCKEFHLSITFCLTLRIKKKKVVVIFNVSHFLRIWFNRSLKGIRNTWELLVYSLAWVRAWGKKAISHGLIVGLTRVEWVGGFKEVQQLKVALKDPNSFHSSVPVTLYILAFHSDICQLRVQSWLAKLQLSCSLTGIPARKKRQRHKFCPLSLFRKGGPL